MRRRDFVQGIAASAAWPLAALAQQTEQIRRVGVLMNTAAEHPQGRARVEAFKQRMKQLGWSEAANLRIDTRWGEDDADRCRHYVAELLALGPDVLLGAGTPAVVALRRATRIVPIVFVQVTNPVGSGLVASLAKPGGNATGFMNFEFSLSGKWLELLKDIVPGL